MVKYKYIGKRKITYQNNQYHTGGIVDLKEEHIVIMNMDLFEKVDETKLSGEEEAKMKKEAYDRLKQRIQRREAELVRLKKDLEGIETPKKKSKRSKE